LNFNDVANQAWKLSIRAQIDIDDILSKVAIHYKPNTHVKSDQPIALHADLTGNAQQKHLKFAAFLSPQAVLHIRNPLGGEWRKPEGQQLDLHGSIAITPEQIKVEETELRVADKSVTLSGVYNPSETNPTIDFNIDVPKELPVGDVLTMIALNEHALQAEGASGKFLGHVHVRGPLKAPSVRGHIVLNDVTVPKLNIEHATGRIWATDWVATGGTETAEIPAGVKLKTITLNKLLFENVVGRARTCITPGCRWFELDAMTADFAKGNIVAKGSVNLDKPSELEVMLDKIDADIISRELLNAPGELIGTINGKANLRIDLNAKDMISAVEGKGNVLITDGRIQRLAALEKGISALNLVHGGILDFNLNNLISTIAPFQSGRFEKIVGDFSVANGALEINKVFYKAQELKMRARGTVHLREKTLHVEVAGRVPRISKRGPLGAIAPFLSISGVAGSVEDLSGVVIGSSGKDAPRSFAFKIDGRLDKPSSISQSVLKTFRWLPNKPGATAHPVVAYSETNAQRAQTH
ncbi:MAG: hypothetical protein IAF58_11110, partial [Leptolyngbya sp.]|nr:hypothetical protein [Candidatus Melainabacteria bacterium]